MGLFRLDIIACRSSYHLSEILLLPAFIGTQGTLSLWFNSTDKILFTFSVADMLALMSFWKATLKEQQYSLDYWSLIEI